jgi:hypothetical protein
MAGAENEATEHDVRHGNIQPSYLFDCFLPTMFTSFDQCFRVRTRIQLGWRIGIRIGSPDPDPGRPKLAAKKGEN